MPEPKLAYRAARKVSEWTLGGYYSQVDVEGADNVPKDGPVIIAATHHNEIIDIAALAQTIPHQRHLSFWAKSTMFSNPIVNAFMTSSGAIPIRRNLNNTSTPVSGGMETTSSPVASSSKHRKVKEDVRYTRSSLFDSTSAALARCFTHGSNEGVVGVFPEGTSYTDASMPQILPGAAWAAVEFARWIKRKREVPTDDSAAFMQGLKVDARHQRAKRSKGKAKAVELESGLKIVPVAIIYTDKANYQSRVTVKYGTPIHVDAYTKELFAARADENPDVDEVAKRAVDEMTNTLSERLHAMTLNASDWDTLCAVSVARSILWEDEDRIELKEWVGISQRLVNLFDLPSDTPSSHPLVGIKNALTKYYALLQHTGIEHRNLASLLPFPSHRANPTSPTFPILDQATASLIPTLPLSLVQFALFLPPMIVHLPGYLTGYLAGRYLVKPGEEEAKAQFRAVGGGVGLAVSIAYWLRVVWRRHIAGSTIRRLGLLRLFGIIYTGVWVLVKWHALLVRPNLRFLQRLVTFGKLIYGFLFPGSSFSSPQTPWADIQRKHALDYFARPTKPSENPFILKRKARAAEILSESSSLSSSVSSLAGSTHTITPFSSQEALAAAVASVKETSSQSQSPKPQDTTSSLSGDEEPIVTPGEVEDRIPSPTVTPPSPTFSNTSDPSASTVKITLQPVRHTKDEVKLPGMMYDFPDDAVDDAAPGPNATKRLLTPEVFTTLVREVVQARKEACVSLWTYLRVDSGEGIGGPGPGYGKEDVIKLRMFLEQRGARIPSITWGW